MRLLLSLLLACIPLATHAADRVVCHVDYGGETRALHATTTTTPYTVPTLAIGSYFLWRLVVEADATKVYVYADDAGGPLPLHVATYPHPLPPNRRAPGFSGWQTVYEPLRDGELRYWCARDAQRRPRAAQ